MKATEPPRISAASFLGRAGILTLRHAFPLLALTIVILGPVAWIRWSLIRTVRLGDISSIVPVLLFFVSFAAAQGFLSAVIAPFVYGRLGGADRGLLDGVAAGLPRHGRAAVAAVAASAAIHGGFLLYLVPGGYAACLLFVVGPVAVMERKSLPATFLRCSRLTAPARAEIALAVVMEVILLLFGVAVVLGMRESLESRGRFWVALAALEGMLALVSLYFAVVQATAYHHLSKSELLREERMGPADPPPFSPRDGSRT